MDLLMVMEEIVEEYAEWEKSIDRSQLLALEQLQERARAMTQILREEAEKMRILGRRMEALEREFNQHNEREREDIEMRLRANLEAELGSSERHGTRKRA